MKRKKSLKMSLKNSKDTIEQLYSSVILLHFPNYEVFWGRFIGDPNKPVPKPYEYAFPKSINSQDINVAKNN